MDDTARSASAAARSCRTTSPCSSAPTTTSSFAEIPRHAGPRAGDAAREHARDEGYTFLGPVEVELVDDDGSQHRASSRSTAACEEGTGGGAGARSCSPTGERIALGEEPVTIGRAARVRHRARRPQREPQPRRDPPPGRRLSSSSTSTPPTAPRVNGVRVRRAAAGRRRRDLASATPAPVRGVVAAPVPEQLLTILKFCFLALLYLFFLRVLRAVWAEVAAPTGGSRRPRPRRSAEHRRALGANAADGKGVARLASGRARRAARAARSRSATRSPSGRAAGCQITVDDTYVSPAPRPGLPRATASSSWRTSARPTAPTSTARRSPARWSMRRGDRLQVGNTVLEVR